MIMLPDDRAPPIGWIWIVAMLIAAAGFWWVT